MTDEPQCIEISVNVSLGGSVQLKQYELSSKYNFSVGGKWTIPESYTEVDAKEFREMRMDELLGEADRFAQHEVDNLLTQKMELSQ